MTELNSNITLVETFAVVACLIPLISGIFSACIPSRYSWLVSISAPTLMLISVIHSILLFINCWNNEPHLMNYEWFWLGEHSLTIGFKLDNLTVVMMLVVSIVSFLVHLYSTGYMAGDHGIRRYFGMLGFFTFSMMGIVLANNLLIIFMCWELVGFSSYLLIGHWYDQPAAGAAARKAFLLNRIGDAGFVMGLMIIYSQTGSFELFVLEENGMLSWQTAAALCVFAGVMGKSAQFPLLTWLPDAMAGPTPVSALIHAATMVAAGVFLLVRVFFLFTPEALDVVVTVGIITSLMGAASALVQVDIKKILAYSTISQLGLMVMAIGLGSKESSLLHLFTHAFFKAGLFLAAGSVIHALHHSLHHIENVFDVQDIRNLGGLRKAMPVTFIVFIICGASLSGIPLFSGFQSKDAILSAALNWAEAGASWRWIVVGGAFLVSFLTVLYTFRLIWYTFLHKPSELSEIENLTIAESPKVMLFPMVVLAMGSFWWMVSPNPLNFSGWLSQFSASHGITIISMVWVFLALIVAYFYYRNKPVQLEEKPLSRLLFNTFYLDTFYQKVINTPTQKVSQALTFVDKRIIDGAIHLLTYVQITISHIVGWCDRVMVDGTVSAFTYIIRSFGTLVRSFHGGKIQNYIFWAVIGLAVLLFYMVN